MNCCYRVPWVYYGRIIIIIIIMGESEIGRWSSQSMLPVNCLSFQKQFCFLARAIFFTIFFGLSGPILIMSDHVMYHQRKQDQNIMLDKNPILLKIFLPLVGAKIGALKEKCPFQQQPQQQKLYTKVKSQTSECNLQLPGCHWKRIEGQRPHEACGIPILF